jgi:hypothetical protein
MGRRLGSLLSAALAALLVVGGALPATAAGERAMWVWDGPVDGVIDFAAAKAVTDLYLHAPPGFSTDARYQVFLTDAHAAGLQVHAMAGDSAWAKQSGPWTAWVDEVVTHGGFDGVVFDVEPYLHADWNTKKQNRLIRSYLAGLDEAAQRAGNLPVLAAVPFWFDEIRVKRTTLVESVLATTDGIVVMAYRDHAEGVDGIIDLSATEAALAASMGRQFVIGVETGAVSPGKVTFAEEGEQFMENELDLVEAEFATNPAFAGFAIHHYASYRTLN